MDLTDGSEAERGGRNPSETTTTTTKDPSDSSPSPEGWRKQHDITIRGHGKNGAPSPYGGGVDGSLHPFFPDPFLRFDQTPFCATIHGIFRSSGFTAPTPIQSQVREF